MSGQTGKEIGWDHQILVSTNTVSQDCTQSEKYTCNGVAIQPRDKERVYEIKVGFGILV